MMRMDMANAPFKRLSLRPLHYIRFAGDPQGKIEKVRPIFAGRAMMKPDLPHKGGGKEAGATGLFGPLCHIVLLKDCDCCSDSLKKAIDFLKFWRYNEMEKIGA